MIELGKTERIALFITEFRCKQQTAPNSTQIPDRHLGCAIAPEADEKTNAGTVDIPRNGATNGLTTAAGMTRKVFNTLAWLRLLFANNRAGMAHMQSCIEKLKHENRQLHTALAELSQKEAESSYLAYHDSLTALPNRRLLTDRFRQAILHADRHQEQVALLFIDLDRFKRVNDECGHVVGDTVLQMVATRIQTAIRATDTACRYGGDEFVVMLPEIESAAIAVNLADEIRRRLGLPYEIDAGVIDLNASVGIAAYPHDGRDWEMLVGHAGAAMHRAKRNHRDGSAASSRSAANGPFRIYAAASLAEE